MLQLVIMQGHLFEFENRKNVPNCFLFIKVNPINGSE